MFKGFFKCLALLSAVALWTVACGSSDGGFGPNVPTDSWPIVSRVDPTTGAAGTAVTIYGLGFTISYPEDVVIIGGVPTSATSYALAPNPTSTEIEQITATVPPGAQVGPGSVVVIVNGNASNADVIFTVLP